MSDSVQKVLAHEEQLRLILGRNLREARLNARHGEGFTQQEVADRYGVSKGTVSAWETGRGDCGAVRLRSLCRLYGVPMDSVFSDHVLSSAALALAEQFDNMNERQKTTLRGMWKAYASGEGLPQPPQDNAQAEDALARSVIERSSGGRSSPAHRKSKNQK